MARVTSGPVFCVVNAGSGRESGDEKAARLRATLARLNRPGEILVATSGDQVGEYARRAVEQAVRNDGIVVVAGGDGTVSAVAREAVPAGVPLGVIPEGTFNMLARAHGIPEDVDDAVAVAFTGVARPVQVGIANDLIFLVNASLGLYPKLLADREELKQRLGRSRFVALLAAIKTLLGQFRPLAVDLDLDGRQRRLKTTTLFVGNNRLQLERLGLTEADASEHGRLVLVDAPPMNWLTTLKLMFQAAIGRLGNASGFEVATFRELEVDRVIRPGGKRRKMGLALDGERFRVETPISISIYPKPMWLIVPRDEPTPADADTADAALAARAEHEPGSWIDEARTPADPPAVR